jgi:hypothetical protein
MCDKLKWLSSHSRWNFESKMNLLTAECQYAQREIGKAIVSYDSAIKSAKEHKFDYELALAYEIAGCRVLLQRTRRREESSGNVQAVSWRVYQMGCNWEGTTLPYVPVVQPMELDSQCGGQRL